MAQRVGPETIISPSSVEERNHALAALDRIERRHKGLLAARGRAWFPSAVEVLRELRGETDEGTA